MIKLCKRFLGLLTVLCMFGGLFGVVVPTNVHADESGQETQILSSSEAQKDCEGVQVGWGKINHPYLSILTMKVLPKRYASIVMVKGSWLRTVTLTKSTDLKLYGLYKDSKGDVYRHVGVTYQNVDYYGYLLEERVTVTEKFGTVATPTPEPVATPIPTATPIPKPTVTPTPTTTPTPSSTTIPEPVHELVYEGYYDKNVIPDKFNTGCSDTSTLEKINSACTVDGVAYSLGDNGSTVVIDLYYKKVNRELPSEVVIRNKDFSDMKFSIRHVGLVESEKTIRFENCKFAYAIMDAQKETVKFYFENCSFNRFSGSNASFERCFFGGSENDGLNPLQNILVQNCYFASFPQWNDRGVHTDAVQIYGKTDVDTKNIVFSNCRVEIPVMKEEGRKVLINACLMVALEYSNAQDFLFENCIINGGGYSIYATDNGGKWVLDNIVFRNISLGSGHLYGDIYPKIASGVSFENLHDTEKLYVASVWKDSEGKVHLSVSNDTAEDKTLLIVTENGKQVLTIPSMATSVEAGAKEYSDLSIDLEIIPVDAESDWVVCYDGEEAQENQIRYVNWSGEEVYRTAN